MNFKMFRFSILSILCALALTAVIFTVSYVSAHEVEEPKRDGVTVEMTYHDVARAGEEGVHTHEYKYSDGRTLIAHFSRDKNTIPPRPSVPSPEWDPSRYPEPPVQERGGGSSQTGLGLRVSQRDITPDPAVVNPTPDPPVDPVSDIPVTTGTGNSPPATTPDTTTESPARTSGPPQSVVPIETNASQERRPGSPLMQPIRVTEYMVRDWSAGSGGLPQWIEVYNPNTEETVNLKGYTFQYATRRSATAPHKVHTLTLAATEDGFSIPGGGVVILATQRLPARKFSGIEVSTQVYNLNIENVLKLGWVLTDADGTEIHRLGREAFGALGDPVAPLHQNQARVSYQVVPSESPSEVYYYGHREDMGSPGFYKQPAPAAPSLVRRKQVGTWAALKK